MLRALGLSFVLVLSGYPISEAGQQIAEGRLYINPVYNWSVSYPKDWSLSIETPTLVVVKTPPILPWGMVGFHSRTVKFKSLNEFVDELMAFDIIAANQRGYRLQVLSKRGFALRDGTSAIEVITLRGTRVVGKSRRVFVLVDKQGLVIDAETYLDSYEQLDPYFDQIISSFTVRR